MTMATMMLELANRLATLRRQVQTLELACIGAETVEETDGLVWLAAAIRREIDELAELASKLHKAERGEEPPPPRGRPQIVAD
jgi:hypothetical protein